MDSRFTLHHGDCLQVLKKLPANSVDSLVCDPPAGISFMGKDWDSDKGGGKEWTNWLTQVMREVIRVMKPGAHGLVWALPRISHRTAMALEWAGFEVRDVVTHLFGTGFPKSLDISKAIDKAAGVEREIVGENPSFRPNHLNKMERYNARQYSGDTSITAPTTDAAKQWSGWGTALKPACEFWFLVRKPLSEPTVAKNVLKWGTGGINIDAGRIGSVDAGAGRKRHGGGVNQVYGKGMGNGTKTDVEYPSGRFPANLVLDEEAAAMLDEQSGVLKSGDLLPYKQTNVSTYSGGMPEIRDVNRKGDTGGASRFFYVAKPSAHEKSFGLKDLPNDTWSDGRKGKADFPKLRDKTLRQNSHPTVKSFKLMRYLINLISPPRGVVLDCFMGSGTTGTVAVACGYRFVGIELSSKYLEIARARIQSVKAQEDLH